METTHLLTRLSAAKIGSLDHAEPTQLFWYVVGYLLADPRERHIIMCAGLSDFKTLYLSNEVLAENNRLKDLRSRFSGSK